MTVAVKKRTKKRQRIQPKLTEEQRLLMQAVDSYAQAKEMMDMAKAEMARWRAIIEEAGVGAHEGHKYRVVVNRGVQRRLDTKALAKEIGEDVLEEFKREVEYTRIDVYPL